MIMKAHILGTFLLVAIFGCSKAADNIELSNSAKSKCPDQPQGGIEVKDVKQVALSRTLLKESGQINSGKQKEFSFDGNKEQRLKYNTSDNVCLWTYSPNNTLVGEDVLPIDGRYAIQIAALKGSTSFPLETGLRNDNDPSPLEDSVPIASLSNNQSSPNAVISEYHQEINSHSYRAAWNKLPLDLQQNVNVHPNGDQSFVDFFDSMGGMEVNRVSVFEKNEVQSMVSADINCELKNDSKSSLFLRFFLNWSSSSQQWQITKVKLDTDRRSACGT
jgi:hypothetical protein